MVATIDDDRIAIGNDPRQPREHPVGGAAEQLVGGEGFVARTERAGGKRLLPGAFRPRRGDKHGPAGERIGLDPAG